MKMNDSESDEMVRNKKKKEKELFPRILFIFDERH
jgi:hypothetical protein